MQYDTDVIEQYRLMVCKLAWQYTRDAELHKDLCQEGQIGLRKACLSYNDDKGACFTTHAYIKIKGQIRQYLDYKVAIVHVPVGNTAETYTVELNNEYDAPVKAKMPHGMDIMTAMRTLDDPDMEDALTEHYVMGTTKVELAEARGLNYQTLSARMNRALKRLRTIMETM